MKKYKEFLNEELKKLDKYEYDTISEMIEEYLDENNIGGSFDASYYNHDGDKDLNGLKKYLNNNSSTNDVLDYFFKKYNDVIYSDDEFISKNGFYDYMLYTYDNSYMLSGNGVGSEPENKLLKYFYGFQTTKLGKIFIKQNFDSFTHFYEICAKEFPEYFFDTVSDVVFNYEYCVGISSTSEYSTSIIIISSLNNNDKEQIKIEFDDEHGFNGGRDISWTLINDLLVVVFGKKVDMEEELERIKDDIEKIKMGKEIKKYNL